MFIPKVVKPFPDELLYSWIYRLSNTNGLLISSFSDGYLGTVNSKSDRLPLDVRNHFVSLYNCLYTKGNMKQLYLDTTTYQFESLFMTKGQQTRYLNNVFREYSSLNPPVNTFFNNAKICPSCYTEDIDLYGLPYLHRSHQLSGICTCYKHNCKLMVCNKNAHSCDFNLKDYRFLDMYVSNVHQLYTRYVQKLFEANISGNIKDLKNILFEKMLALDYSANDNYKSFMQSFVKNPSSKIFIGDVEKFLRIKMAATKNVRAQEIIPIMMFIFPDVGELINKLKFNIPNIGLYQCPQCEKYYCSTIEAFSNGWGCPYCNKDKDGNNKLQALIKSINSEYQLISEFISLNKNVTMHHNYCNSNFKINPRRFLFDGIRCKCENIVTMQNAKEKIESYTGYKLIEFTTCSEPIKVLCEKCGHYFFCNYYKFIKYPGCRICKSKSMTKERCRQRVNELLADEYTLVKEFNGKDEPVILRHNKCGREQKYKIYNFLDGQRCHYCNSLSRDSSWYKGYELLCQYKDEYGMIDVPKRYSYKEYNLGFWCQRQRVDKKKGILNDICIEKLNDLGFCWNPLDQQWNRSYEQYKKYIACSGKVSISRRTDFEGEHLGNWVATQRKRYKEGKLISNRINMLRALGMDFRE